MLREATSEQSALGEPLGIRKILDAFRRIVRDLRLSSREAERDAGIGGAQLFVLQALARGTAASLNELAERTHTHQSSVSVVVRRLLDRKLVASRSSRVDARRIELSLTPAGRRMLARCPEPTQVRLVEAIERLGASELAALTRGLGALVREMGIEESSPPMFFEESPGPAPRRVRRARDDE